MKVIEIMKWSMLGHHWEPVSTGQLLRLSMKLLSSTNQRYMTQHAGVELGNISLAREPLIFRPLSRHPTVLMYNFNQTTLSRHRLLLSSMGKCLTRDTARLHWSQLLIRSPRIPSQSFGVSVTELKVLNLFSWLNTLKYTDKH